MAPTTPKPRSAPLYSIRPDAVLIHHHLPGFPITNPPTVVAALNSPTADFMVATALPPVNWPGMLSWYGISQPRRAHIWSIRALLHLYLLLAAHRDIGEEGGESVPYIRGNPHIDYKTLVDQGTHYVGNFVSRTPEMLLIALHKAKENQIQPILFTLMSVAQASDKTYDSGTVPEFVEHLQATAAVIRTAVSTNTLLAMELTRRRAGIIERAIYATVRLAHPERPDKRPITPMSHDVKHISLHKNSLQDTVGPGLAALSKPYKPTKQPNPVTMGASPAPATPTYPSTPNTPTEALVPTTEHAQHIGGAT